jgi:hypothetical protein
MEANATLSLKSIDMKQIGQETCNGFRSSGLSSEYLDEVEIVKGCVFKMYNSYRPNLFYAFTVLC